MTGIFTLGSSEDWEGLDGDGRAEALGWPAQGLGKKNQRPDQS